MCDIIQKNSRRERYGHQGWCGKKSLYLSEYYNNRLEPYFEHLADNVIWHGPAIGQQIIGRRNMREAWDNSPNHLTFSLGNVEAQYIQLSPASCEVMMMFVVKRHYPNGDVIQLFQRIQLNWADISITDENKHKKRVTRIFMIHISNPVEQHSDDFIYPEHYNELLKQAEKPVQEPRSPCRYHRRRASGAWRPRSRRAGCRSSPRCR